MKCDGLTAGAWRDRTSTASKGSAVIQIYNAEGAYDLYYYVNNAYSTYETLEGDNIHTGWAKGQVLVTGLSPEDKALGYGSFKTGSGFWFSCAQIGQNTATLTTAGEVVQVKSRTLPVAATDLQALCNIYPMDYDIANIGCTLPAGVWRDRTSKTGKGSPCIQIMNADGAYDLYYYVNNAYSTYETIEGDNIHTGWAKGQVLVSGLSPEDKAAGYGKLKAGEGFWLQTNGLKSDGEISFTYSAD